MYAMMSKCSISFLTKSFIYTLITAWWVASGGYLNTSKCCLSHPVAAPPPLQSMAAGWIQERIAAYVEFWRLLMHWQLSPYSQHCRADWGTDSVDRLVANIENMDNSISATSRSTESVQKGLAVWNNRAICISGELVVHLAGYYLPIINDSNLNYELHNVKLCMHYIM